MTVIRVDVLSRSDRDSYHQFLDSCPYGHFMQTWEWGEVKRLTDWRPTRLGAFREGSLAGVVSVLERDLPYVNKPLLYVPAGPCVDYDSDPEIARALLEAVCDLGREKGAVFVKADPVVPAEHPHIEGILREAGFKRLQRGLDFESIQPRFVWQLPLEGKDADDLMKGFHSKTRYNIRLARRKGVEIRAAESEKDLKRFYEVLRETSSRQSFMIRGYEYYLAIWREMIERDLARLFLAEYEDQLLAGTMAFITQRHCWYVYGASSNRHRNVMPNYLLQWTMINWALERGCDIYDFRGISGDPSPDNPLYGLYRFKKGFGGYMVEYVGEYDAPLSPALYFLSTRAEPLYRKLRGMVARRSG